MQLCNCNFTTFMHSIKHTPHLLTTPPHLSYTARRSNGQLWQGRVSWWASRQNKTNHATSRHIAPNHASGSPVLRTFAVAKVLPLGFTDKKRFIARYSLKRTFVT